MRKTIMALSATLIPILVMFFIVAFNVKLQGTPLWVGYVWIAGCVYWAVTLVALIVLVIMRKGVIAKGVGIGVAIGFFLLVIATGLQM
jgi:hypothetical protein